MSSSRWHWSLDWCSECTCWRTRCVPAPSDLVTTAAAVAGCAVILFWEPVTAGLWARTPGHWLAGTALGSSSRLRRFGWELRWALVWSWLAGGAYVILVPDVTILGWAAAVALVPLPVLALWAIRLLGQPISVVEVRASRLRRQQPAPLRTSRLRVTGVAGVVLLTMALAAGCDSAGEPLITTVQTAEQHDPDGTVRAVDWTDRTDRNGRAIDLSCLGSYAVVLYRLVNPTPLAVLAGVPGAQPGRAPDARSLPRRHPAELRRRVAEFAEVGHESPPGCTRAPVK